MVAAGELQHIHCAKQVDLVIAECLLATFWGCSLPGKMKHVPDVFVVQGFMCCMLPSALEWLWTW